MTLYEKVRCPGHTQFSLGFIPEPDIPPFPLTSIADSQANSLQTYTVIPTERHGTEWAPSSPIEGGSSRNRCILLGTTYWPTTGVPIY